MKIDISHIDELSTIALNVLHEIKDELQDGWYERALDNLEGKRKVVPPEEYVELNRPPFTAPEEPDDD